MFILIGLMVMTAFYKFRRIAYNIFYKIHMILVVLVIGLGIFHGAHAIFGGVILWVLDMLIRLKMKNNHKTANKMMKIEKVAEDILKLSFEKKDFEYSGG